MTHSDVDRSGWQAYHPVMNKQVITKDAPMTPELERFIKGEVIIEEGPMPPELALQFEQARRNLKWFSENADRLEVFKLHRGRFVASVGGELLVADTPEEIHRLVEEKYPNESAHVRYIPREKRFRIYAC